MARKELSPVSNRERFLTNPGFVVLWASLGMGIPAIVLGAMLGSEQGMGLTYIQILLVVPIGLIIGGAVISGIGWMAADMGVPTGLLFRPGLGLAGSWVASVFQALLYIAWAALEMQVGATLLEDLAAAAGYPITYAVSITIVTALVAALVWMGMSWVSGVLIRRFTFWIALAVVFWLFADVITSADLAGLQARIPDQSAFWLAIDLVVSFVVLWVPLAGDTARFAKNSSAAASGVGFGFGIGLAMMLLMGATVGLAGGMDGTVDGSLDFLLGTAGTLAIVVGMAWLLAGMIDQPFGFVYGASTAIAATVRGRAPLWLSLVVVGLGGVTAAVATPGSLVGLGSFLLAVLTPLIAIVLADFFIVRRRRYLTDALYQTGGPYGPVNFYGLSSFFVAFAVQQWIRPTGPVAWIEILEEVPGAGIWGVAGVPAVIVGMLVAFAMYSGLGRWKIAEWESVSRIRF